MLQKTLNYFKEISKIPRCSGNEEELRNYLQSWADSKKLQHKIDEAGNLVVYVPGTPLREQEKTIIIQNHMDMVCVKSDNSDHDFKRDEIKIIEEDGFLQADNTTLGADNGIGLSMAMSLVDLLSHPPLELLFTTSEEIGLIGARNLDPSILNGKYLINLDSEDEGELFVGCAGGSRIEVSKKYKTIRSSYTNYKLIISGLKGGHSGIDIDKRVNIIFEFLKFINSYFSALEIGNIKSGIADNAIPTKIEALLSIANIDFFKEKLLEFLKYLDEVFGEEYINYNLEEYESTIQVITEEDKGSFLNTIIENANGVVSMIPDSDSVRTSRSLGIIDFSSGILDIVYLYRSSKSSEFDTEIENMRNLLRYNGFNVNEKYRYYGWEEDMSSSFVKKIKKIYENVIGKEVSFIRVHAGLECGIVNSKLNGRLKMLSFGPNISGGHTINEKCEIKSVGVICDLMEEILKSKFE